MMFSTKFSKTTDVRVVIPKNALEVVFDECDRFDADETGGRILGTYSENDEKLVITVTGIIEPGPSAKRTATYFMQDGSYQENVFRKVEEQVPSIEHLGNWHTHHVNGLHHLSDGDIATYRRIVEHKQHNTDFFYALLVVEKKPRKTGLERYVFKNYLFRRGDPKVYEIPPSATQFVDAQLVWPTGAGTDVVTEGNSSPDTLKKNRVYDQDVVSHFFPSVKVFMSKELGVYWRGPIDLIDGSKVEAVVVERLKDGMAEYALTLRKAPLALSDAVNTLSGKGFDSCHLALISVERACNVALYERQRGEV